MNFSIRKEVEEFSPYEAGLSIEEIRDKYKLEKVIKLASNENPLGTSKKIIKLLEEKASYAFRYPQSGNPRLKNALAQKHNVSPSRIALGNGLDEVIDVLIRVLATPNKNNIVAFNPCFGIYKTQAKLCGIELRQAPLKPDFSFDIDALLALVDDNTSIVFLTNPDNPSGYAMKREEIEIFASHLPKTTLLVIDEAYIDFASEKYQCEQLAHDFENVAILRTFSKCYGLAGMRIGYGIFPEQIADYMGRIRLPFSINILGEEAALLALEDKEFYNDTLELTKNQRIFLSLGLETLGCKIVPSQANFILVSLKTSELGQGLFEFLLTKGIIVRNLASYDMPHALRITIGTQEENALLLKYTKEFLLCHNHL